MKYKEDQEYFSNRDNKTKPKYGKFWCNKCDANIVYIGQKCKCCSYKHKTKRLKK